MTAPFIILGIIAAAVLLGLAQVKRHRAKIKDYYPRRVDFEPAMHPMCRCAVIPIRKRPKRCRRRPKGQTGRKHPKEKRR